MSNESYKRDIDIHEVDLNLEYTDDSEGFGIDSPKIVINKASRLKRKALTIADIQDKEDKYDRQETHKTQLKHQVNRNGKGKKKRKLIQYDYGDDDEEINIPKKPVSQKSDVKPKVLYATEAMSRKGIGKRVTPGFAVFDYNNSKARREICTLILDNFEHLNLVESFTEDNDPVLLVHLFRIYIYSIVYDQEQSFLEANNGMFSPEAFAKILWNLLQVNELNFNFDAKFMAGNNIEPESDHMNKRTVEKIEVPTIILKRLGIIPDLQ